MTLALNEDKDRSATTTEVDGGGGGGAGGWKDFAAGTAGGFVGKLIDYPLDTVKVLLQTQNVGASSSASSGNAIAASASASPSSAGVAMTTLSSAANPAAAAPNGSVSVRSQRPPSAQPPTVYRGAYHCLTHTLSTSGIRGLYRGLSSPLAGSMAENAVLFVTFGQLKRMLGEVPGEKDLTLYQLGLAGAGAGAVVSFVLTPVELVKCRLQVQSSIGMATGAGPGAGGFRLYKGPMDVIVQTLRDEGLVRGLYRGHMSTLLREIPGNFCWYGVYEAVCKSMIPEGGTKSDLGPSAHILGGACAGVAYWTAFYPADTVKSYLQTHPDRTGKNRGFVDTMALIYRREGMGGLYRGWGVTVARAAPAHAAIFAGYEYAMKLLRPIGGGGDDRGW